MSGIADARTQASHHRVARDIGSPAHWDSRGDTNGAAAATAAILISKLGSSRKKGAAGGAVAAPSLDDIKSNQSLTHEVDTTFDALCSLRGEHGESSANLTNCFGGTFTPPQPQHLPRQTLVAI